MLLVGLVLLILGFVLGVPLLWTLGVLLVLIGAILWIAESAGATWGRRWY